MPVIDITRQRFGRLIALSPSNERTSDRTVRWVCQCDCGNTTVRDGKSLRNGDAISCGCYQREMGDRTRKSGMSRTSTYAVWAGMHRRCEEPSEESYERYGGRGIKVCERWNTWENFLADMGEKPQGMSIDRVDNDGHYEPGNCRWATSAQQARNTSRNVFIEFDGRRMILTDWAREVGLHPSSLGGRLRKGWPIERALTTPASNARSYP